MTTLRRWRRVAPRLKNTWLFGTSSRLCPIGSINPFLCRIIRRNFTSLDYGLIYWISAHSPTQRSLWQNMVIFMIFMVWSSIIQLLNRRPMAYHLKMLVFCFEHWLFLYWYSWKHFEKWYNLAGLAFRISFICHKNHCGCKWSEAERREILQRFLLYFRQWSFQSE